MSPQSRPFPPFPPPRPPPCWSEDLPRCAHGLLPLGAGAAGADSFCQHLLCAEATVLSAAPSPEAGVRQELFQQGPLAPTPTAVRGQEAGPRLCSSKSGLPHPPCPIRFCPFRRPGLDPCPPGLFPTCCPVESWRLSVAASWLGWVSLLRDLSSASGTFDPHRLPAPRASGVH